MSPKRGPKPKYPVKVIVKLSLEMVAEIDKVVKEGWFSSRSDFIRAAIADKLKVWGK